ncbi:MAG: hypothetical protein PHS30_01585 [Bacteroidales bacterium]|nr:hypothetical protein [Bacteroidales bacterium]
MNKLKNLLITVFAGLILIFLFQPVINYGFRDFPFILMVLIVLWVVLNKKDQLFTIVGEREIRINKNIGKVPLILLSILLTYIVIFPAVTSWALFRSQDYRKLIGQVDVGKNLSNHMMPISLEKIRVVDQDLAQILGDKVLGSQSALGSQVRLGTFNIQKVNNELYWVAPLLHSGFFKWLSNNQGANGYVMVNATNERDVRLVQEVNGKGVFIKYQSEAYFFDNLKRFLYFKGYFFQGLTDYSFEIDDAGNPYWVVTKFRKTIGFSGDEASGVIVVNAQTGEINDYQIKDAPAWIDRIQPAEFVESQLNNWGNFVKGYWNFSNENKLQITEPVSLVYGDDNQAYWYTGLTSVGADESTVGFVLVNTRSKKAIWYKQSGATEYAARNSARGKVQEKGYSTSAPIPYNINNIPTYVMTLKDNAGLVKMYAMVAIEDYTIVGVGNTLREALMSYKNVFNTTGNKISAKSKTEKNLIASVVTRINGDNKNGNTFYYFTLSSSKSIFIGSSQISNEFPITTVGDSVEVQFDNDNQDVIDVSSFKNKSIKK